MKLLALARYDQSAASSRQRLLSLHGLASASVEVVSQQMFDGDYLSARWAGKRGVTGAAAVRGMGKRLWFLSKHALHGTPPFDVVVVEKEALPFVPAKLERWLLNRVARQTVYDIDDAQSSHYRLNFPGRFGRLAAQRIEELWRHADAVAAGSDGLVENSRELGCKLVTLVPTPVDVADYSPHDYELAPTGPLVIAWIGTPSTQHYLEIVADALAELHESTGVTLLAIGADRLPDQVSAFGSCAAWSVAMEREILSTADVGIMPLTDDEVSQGKCGYKLIQYMAAAIPSVASPVGFNSSLLGREDQRVGLLASSKEEWIEALSLLLTRSELRRSLGETGRCVALVDYSREAHCKLWNEIFDQLGIDQMGIARAGGLQH